MSRMKNADNDMAYIRRRDKASDVTHGWQIAMQRKGVAHQKFFSDSRWGGCEQALATAKRYRDDLLLKYPPLLKREAAMHPRKGSRTGYTGVTRNLIAGRRVWLARVTLPNGKVTKRSFPEKRYGRTLARALAIAAHQQLVEQYVAPADCRWKFQGELRLPDALSQEKFAPKPRLWVKVSVRAPTPSVPKPNIMIRVADGVHGEIKRSVSLAHHGPVDGKRRAIEILSAALIALTGEAYAAQFLQDHAAKIKRLPKQGFRLNVPLDVS